MTAEGDVCETVQLKGKLNMEEGSQGTRRRG